ncbi:capsular biosynthesis protein [Photobacterium leiognathi]|uniref:capsular biosynthesis protein n=1 Tax=Photobacterium leiognathi TaxID=553611 RepID=UPI0029813816|nr:capsular biosynthesis protein [Photobacterium leiognathi]
MFLIMSAAYIDIELQSEFGQLPPSLLPLGNRRLFQHQVALFPDGVSGYLSLPESFQLSDMDICWLTEHNVNVIKTPDGLSLGASLVAALNLIEQPLETPLHVLFGDTLISPLPIGNDIVSVSLVEDSYNWATVNKTSTNLWLSEKTDSSTTQNHVVCGYFKFSQPRHLMRCITQNHWYFLDGLNRYQQEIGLKTITTDNWLDFGHVNTYYRSKAKFTTQRAFNELTITPNWIEKSSYKTTKIQAEANWFEQLPTRMRNYIPQFMGSYHSDKRFKYRLEYLHHTALNELYVFSHLPSVIWQNIFHRCLDFITECQHHLAPDNVPNSSLEDLFGRKTAQRLDEYCLSQNISMDDTWNYNGEEGTLTDLIALSEKWLPCNENHKVSVLHGDFCFSNILYDFRTNRIKTIDPRGLTHANEQTIYGDTRYDLAKLSHSILGMYDWIIAGYYHVKINDKHIDFSLATHPQLEDAQQLFIDMISDRFNLSPMNLYAMQIQLFLSMLPLHDDDKMRQDALFANAFRLYDILKGYTQ